MLRRAAMVFTLVGLLGVVACAPVKKAPPGAMTPPSIPPQPGAFITQYAVWEAPFGGEAVRSSSPFAHTLPSGATGSQALLADGSVVLTISDNPTNVRTDFGLVPVRLGDIDTIDFEVASIGLGNYRISLIFDVDADGDFLDWDPSGQFLGQGNDIYAVIVGGPFYPIVDLTEFELLGGSNSQLTLADLKAGVEPGVDADTEVVIVVGLHVFAIDDTTTVTSLTVNGVDLLVP